MWKGKRTLYVLVAAVFVTRVCGVEIPFAVVNYKVALVV